METTQLDTFLTGLKSYLDAQTDARKSYNREVALEFNPMLQFFSIGENKFSDIIAYFLNPQEKHGQGGTFLEAFLQMEGLPCSEWADLNLESAEVVRESGVNSRRMDIYIQFPESNYGIGIEMKIWAGDQKNQLQDYHTWLKDKHGSRQCLFYWRPYDTAPGEHSLTKEQRDALVKANQFYEINHEEWTVALLEKWLSVCRAENVRTFLKQLLQFINHEINGERFMGQHDQIAEYLKQNRVFLEMALQVIDAQNSIKIAAIDVFKKAWEGHTWPQGVSVAGFRKFSPEEKYAGFVFNLTDNAYPFNIGFDWAEKGFKNGYFGFIAKRKGESNKAKEYFTKVLGKGEYTDAWPWHTYLKTSYRNLSMQDFIGEGQNAFLKAISEKIEFLLAGLQKAPFP